MRADCEPFWGSPMNIYTLGMSMTLQDFMCPWPDNIWQVLMSGSIRQGFRSQVTGILVFLTGRNGRLLQQKHTLLPPVPTSASFTPAFPSCTPQLPVLNTNCITFVWASASVPCHPGPVPYDQYRTMQQMGKERNVLRIMIAFICWCFGEGGRKDSLTYILWSGFSFRFFLKNFSFEKATYSFRNMTLYEVQSW